MNKKLDDKLLNILSNKPEIIIDFPKWMLSSNEAQEIKRIQNKAIAEIAGRDSFAAVIKACELRNFKAIIPTIAYTGTEFGNWNTVFEKIKMLKNKLKKFGIKVYKTIILGSPNLWRLLCGKHSLKHYRNFNFFSPCLGCHLYLHAIRIPLAKMLNCKIVIGGERELHNGNIKINQIKKAIDAYIRLYKKFNLELYLPVRYISSGEEIEKIIGKNWEEGKEQTECVLSGNYRDIDGSAILDENAVKRYFDEFALEEIKKYIKKYINIKTIRWKN